MKEPRNAFYADLNPNYAARSNDYERRWRIFWRDPYGSGFEIVMSAGSFSGRATAEVKAQQLSDVWAEIERKA